MSYAQAGLQDTYNDAQLTGFIPANILHYASALAEACGPFFMHPETRYVFISFSRLVNRLAADSFAAQQSRSADGCTARPGFLPISQAASLLFAADG